MIASFVQLMQNSYSGLSRDVWILAFITLINRTGSMIIVFMTIYLTSELNFTLTQAGIVMSCYGLGSVVGAYIGGWLTDRVGYYPTMFWSLFLGGLTFFGLMQVTTFYNFCLAVFFVSSVVDTFRPASMASIGSYSKPENHNRSLSLIRLAINLGFAGGAVTAGLISANFGYDWLFIIDGGTCIAAAFFLKATLKEKKDVVVNKEGEVVESTEMGPSAYEDSNFLFFICAKGLAAIAFMQLFSTFPVFVKNELGYTEDQFGYLMLINGLIIVFLEMPMVYILERKYKRLTMVVFGYGLFLIGFLSLTLSTVLLVTLLFFIVMMSIGEIVGFPFSNAFALSRSTAGRRGEFMGLYSMAFSIAFIIAPVLGMYIAENYGFQNLWRFISLLSVLSVVCFVIVKGKIDRETTLRKEEVVVESV